MALPIKPKDTQEGCNPISSNCVIWQGPDIPCINLCNGDSVSDVVAKLAEELCTIVDQLDISFLDISCFGALAPEPADFRDVIQLLINRICNLEADTGGGVSSAGCPDDCLIPLPQCLQFTDPLGNVVTELVLRDYMILIANRICTILSQITALSSSVVNIEGRLTVIEETLAGLGGGVTIDITSSNCVGNNLTQPIQNFVLALESELCRVIASVGTPTEINNAISQQCIVDGQPLDNAPQLSNPASSMANIPGWVSGASYNTLADAVNNLWLTVCDMRTTIADIQATLANCCSVSCDDVDWNFTATGLNSTKFITLFFSGSIPAGFVNCGPALTTAIVVNNSLGESGVYNYNVVNAIQTGASINLDLDLGGASEYALWYQVRIPLCVTDGTNTCNTLIEYDFVNTAWCSTLSVGLSSAGVTPTTGTLTASWTAPIGPAIAGTTYQIRLFSVTGSGLPVQLASASVTGVSGAQTYAFGTFTQVAATSYYVVITSVQGSHSQDCTSSTIALQVSP
jgi:hypothetical protein